MPKGIITPKVKRSTLTRGLVQKANVKKHVKIQERHDTWTKRLETIAKERQQQKKQKAAQKAKNPLAALDDLESQLEQIEVKPASTKPVNNPHLKRVVTQRGRKLALRKEKQQFLKVLAHPVFQANPLGAIETHLTNVMAQVTQNLEEPKK